MKLLLATAVSCVLVLCSVKSFLAYNSKYDNNNGSVAKRIATGGSISRTSETISTEFAEVEQPTPGKGRMSSTEAYNVQTTTFYATGDAPYTRKQAVKLKEQFQDVPSDAEFVIHIGDIRRAGPQIQCLATQYAASADLLRGSHVPVFVLIGDNDWTDCPGGNQGREEGFQSWQSEFIAFESKHWEHSFVIQRQPGREYNFAFQHKGALFLGLNIIAGEVHDEDEWSSRLTEQAKWTMDLIRSYHEANGDAVGRVVIFGHASPGKNQRPFFHPLRAFIKDELKSEIPIFYLNGDTHRWLYQPKLFDEPSLLRVTVSGLVLDPLLKVTVTADGHYVDPVKAFAIDRRLSL